MFPIDIVIELTRLELRVLGVCHSDKMDLIDVVALIGRARK